MNSTPPPVARPHLQLLQGSDALNHIDLTYLLEELDLREALPLLRALQLRRKQAANSTLSLVAPAPEQ